MSEAMKPGRELDALVAEKVFGYRLTEDGDTWYLPNDIMGKKYFPEELPRYSAEIAAAWEIVEKLKQGNWGVTVEFVPADTSSQTSTWRAALYDAHYDETEAYGDSAPHAICLAALAAIAAGAAGEGKE